MKGKENIIVKLGEGGLNKGMTLTLVRTCSLRPWEISYAEGLNRMEGLKNWQENNSLFKDLFVSVPQKICFWDLLQIILLIFS